MEWRTKIITFTFLTLVPTLMGSSSKNTRFDMPRLDINKIEVISSVPQGVPISPEDIRCYLPTCSGYGYRLHPIKKTRKFHKGIDLPCKTGTPILSTSYGVVSKVEHKRYGYGRNISVRSGDYTTRFAHCSKVLKREGDYVRPGDTIALAGNTGLSTAPHCHYEVLYKGEHQDPLDFID